MEHSGQKKTRILVVDDLPEGQTLLANVLKGAGYDVVTAANGLEALDLIESEPVDIIISDILMPKMDGFQFCRAVKSQARFQTIPFIFYTASYADQADEQFSLSLGADRFIIKPVEPFGFLAVLKAVLEEETKKTLTLIESNTEFLVEHNARLIRKLEAKLLELEQINEKLQLQEAELKQHSEQLEEMVAERTRALRESQERLLDQEKLTFLGQLAGDVGNELRNPLSSIGNAVYYLRTILDMNNESAKEYLEIISSEVQRAHGIIYNLLDLTQIRPSVREHVKIISLVNLVLEKNPPPENVTVKNNLTQDLPMIYADPEQVIQVLTNIVTNAYRAMPAGGSLSIDAGLKNKMLCLSLQDTGCGIAPEMIGKIFEPRVSFSQKGLGLGLTLARNLTEINGGEIEVESKQGKGSTFTVALPCQDKQKDKQKDKQDKAPNP